MIVISQVPPPTHGSTIVTKILLEILAESNVPVRLVDRRFSRSVAEVGSFSLRKILAVPSIVLRLMGAVVSRPAMCIFFCTNRPFSFLVDVLLGEVLRMFKVRTINYVHTSGYADLAARGSVWRYLVRRLLSNGVRTVCLAESLKVDIKPFVKPGSISVIPNTIEEPPLVPPGQQAERRRRTSGGHVLFLSNLLEEKGADVFVDMAVDLCARSRDLTFALVGQDADPGLADELRLRVERSGYGDRVVFRGARFGHEKWDEIARAELLIFPSRYRFEAQPLTIIEAFSLGLPVVASDVGAIREMVGPENGYLLPEPTAEAASAAVASLMADPAERTRLADGARRTYEMRHSRVAFRKAWQDVFALTREDAL
ncbi:glycosyltransferase [Curtobacterium sp. NPDC089185]|uniref:glycosyltransferase family 4 protein n=1 Tax=Curtobacterium sp. NPDC089185 TaxID=3154968 RepID=UPI003418E0E7